jgi:hypothetical protein
MRPKVILQLYPVFPPASEADRKARRLLGRDGALYWMILYEWVELLKEAEKLGVWGPPRSSITCTRRAMKLGAIF